MSDRGGNVDKAKGRTKKAAGEVSGDESLKNEGRIDKASGSIKKAVGEGADKAKRAVNPRHH